MSVCFENSLFVLTFFMAGVSMIWKFLVCTDIFHVSGQYVLEISYLYWPNGLKTSVQIANIPSVLTKRSKNISTNLQYPKHTEATPKCPLNSPTKEKYKKENPRLVADFYYLIPVRSLLLFWGVLKVPEGRRWWMADTRNCLSASEFCVCPMNQVVRGCSFKRRKPSSRALTGN